MAIQQEANNISDSQTVQNELPPTGRAQETEEHEKGSVERCDGKIKPETNESPEGYGSTRPNQINNENRNIRNFPTEATVSTSGRSVTEQSVSIVNECDENTGYKTIESAEECDALKPKETNDKNKNILNLSMENLVSAENCDLELISTKIPEIRLITATPEILSESDCEMVENADLKWESTKLMEQHLKMSTLELTVTEKSISKPFFELKFFEQSEPVATYRIVLKNTSALFVELQTAHLTQKKTKLLAILPEGERIRMGPDNSWKKEFTLTDTSKDIKQTKLIIAATFLISDKYKPDIHETYTFVKHNYKTAWTGIELQLADLPSYETPEIVKSFIVNNFKYMSTYGPEEVEVLDKVKRSKACFIQSRENYKEQLLLLNQIEDEHLKQQFSSYTLNNPIIVFEKASREFFYYTLTMDQFAQRPALLRKDIDVEVVSRVGTEYVSFEGIIDQMDHSKMTLEMKEFMFSIHFERIEFFPDRTTFRLEYRALQLLDETIINNLCFPESIGTTEMETIDKFYWFRRSVSTNAEQATAVMNIVNCTAYPAPYILYGPPGTGKTSTIVEAICQIYKLRKDSNVLVAAASNSAANEIVDRLLIFMPSKAIYRFFAKSSERKKNEINRSILDVSNLGTGFHRTPYYDNIYLPRVVVCTLTTAGRLAQAGICTKHFNYIFIDECGSAKEVSALVAVVGIGTDRNGINAQVVLAGDPKQLGPVIMFDYLKNTSHGISMLERMMNLELYRKNSFGEYNTQVITQLRDNFRSHGAILNYSNTMFYDSQLRVKVPEEVGSFAIGWPWLPNQSFPVIFHPINGEMVTDSGSSLYNRDEAHQIMNYLHIILEGGVNGKRVQQNEIGVLSPYARQVAYLRNLCNNCGWQEIEIGSTEQYQGQEKPIMLISTVRSRCPTVGFLTDVKRLNVALTRARSLMIVVGNLKTLQQNTHWNTFIAYCSLNGGVVRQ